MPRNYPAFVYYSSFNIHHSSLFLVRVMGLEPIHLSTHAPQTCLSANSSTPAHNVCHYSKSSPILQALLRDFFRKINIYFPNSTVNGNFICSCNITIKLIPYFFLIEFHISQTCFNLHIIFINIAY